MCGIAGILARDGRPAPPEAVLGGMLATLTHRGPDDEGRHLDGPIAFGTRRLAIIDVAGGHQPLSNADGSVWVALNGEIYNYVELAEDVARAGRVMRTQSDTETIAHLYDLYGEEALARLNGMFAVAIWDARSRRLLLARDRMGIKPLYYALTADTLVFGSELKAVLASGLVPRELDLGAARDYTALFYVPTPECIVRGVRKLGPGQVLVVEGRADALRTYWSVPSGPPRQRPLEEEIGQFRALFRDAVRIQMRSDVPYGAFLSGGVDSSAVVGTMAGLSAGPVKAFSIGFEGGAYYDELPYARQVAARFGADHEAFTVSAERFDLLEKMAYYFDEPFADAALLPTFLLAEMSRRKVTVVLTGDGGDELFAGYDRYRSEVLAEWAVRLPSWVRRGLLPAALGAYRGPARWRLSDVVRQARRKLALLDLPGHRRYAAHFEVFDAAGWDRLAGPALREAGPPAIGERFGALLAEPGSDEFLTRRMRLDLRTWLPDQMLTKVDRATMAHGLEARLPFLDHRLVEFAMGLSDRAKFSLRTPKRFLKRAFADLLPRDILHRRKHGFEVPIAEWLRGPLRAFTHAVLDRRSLERHGLFDVAFVGRMVQEHETGTVNWSREIFGLLVFQLWYDKWMGPLVGAEDPTADERAAPSSL